MKSKTRTRLLTKVLAVTVFAASVLHGGMNAEAAPRIRTNSTSRWMYTNTDKSFSMAQYNWLDADTNEPFNNFGRMYTNGNGLLVWHLQSSLTNDGNDNTVSYDNAAAPACVYASNIDITSQSDSRRVMRFVLYPTNNATENFGIRLGIMLKYVDKNHWAFLGFNGSWYVQWMNGSSKGYAKPNTNDTDGEGDPYQTTDGTTKTGWYPAFQNVKPTDDEYFRITIIYEDATHIRVRMAPCELDHKDEVGNVVLNEKMSNGVSQAKEDTLDFKLFGDLREYAHTDAQNPKGIYMGFAAGTDKSQVSSAPDKAQTKIDIVNVMKGALRPANNDTQQANEYTDSDYKEKLSLINYADCGWVSPKGKDPEEILKPYMLGDGDAYASIGKVGTGVNNSSLNATIYNKTVPDFYGGTVSGILHPYEVGGNKEFYLGIMANQALNAADHTSFKIGIKGTKWVYSLDGQTPVEITGSSLPAITASKDYELGMTIAAGKLTASVTCDGTKTNLIGSNNAINVNGLSGNICLSAKGSALRIRNITCQQTYKKSALENKYNELINANHDHTLYDDVWEDFIRVESTDTLPQGPLGKAKETLDGNNSEMASTDAAYTPFNDAAATALQQEFDRINVPENQVETGKQSLRQAINKIETILDSSDAPQYYTAKSLADVRDAKEDAETLLTSMNSENFNGITKQQILETLASIDERSLDAQPLIDALKALLNQKTAGINLETDEKYFEPEGWNKLKEAVTEAQELLAEGAPSPIKSEIDAVSNKLNDTSLVLKKASQTDLDNLAKEIGTIKATVNANKYPNDTNWREYQKQLAAAETLAGGNPENTNLRDIDYALAALRKAFGALQGKKGPQPGERYTVDQTTYIIGTVDGTVELEIGNKNASKVTINTVIIENRSYAVTSIAKDAYKKSKKLKNVKIGDNVVSIGKNAFSKCSNLKSVTFGKKVTKIDGGAFSKCPKLKKVIFKGTAVKTIAKKSFKGSKVNKVKVPKSLKKNKAFLKKVKKAGMKVSKLS